MTPPAEKDPPHDPLADLDDDLGDDWESAFEAEDFMVSDEDESSDFFLFDDTDPSKSEDLGGEDQKKAAQTGEDSTTSSPKDGSTETSGVLEFPNRLQILSAALLQFFQARPPYQRLLISSLPVLLILIIAITLIFQPTRDELPPLDEHGIVSESSDIAHIPQNQISPSTTTPQYPSLATTPTQDRAVAADTIQQKWQLPTFIIVAASENKADLIVSIDLTLIAYLDKNQLLPEDKQTFARDIIYQFYANRPAHELKHFALARGDMISQLNAWLNKQWQNNPIDAITFSRYHVIQTSPPIVPKVTLL